MKKARAVVSLGVFVGLVGCSSVRVPEYKHPETPTKSDYDEAWAKIGGLKDENDFIRVLGAPTLVYDLSPPSTKDIEIYGIRPRKKQWTFEPAGSRITYVLQLMADGKYETGLHARHKPKKKS